MSDQHLLKHSDTFSEWMDKINNLIESSPVNPADPSGPSGPSGSAKAILLFDKSISSDIIIESDNNALSVSPTVEDGVTVTVSEGSVWVVL